MNCSLSSSPSYLQERSTVSLIQRLLHSKHVPGDMIVFDWRSAYMAEGLLPAPGGEVEWIEIRPGDAGLITAIDLKSSKPFTVLFGRNRSLVCLSLTMINNSKKLSC